MATLTAEPRARGVESHPPRPRRFTADERAKLAELGILADPGCRVTADEYMKMAEAGIFVEGERVELMDGVIIEMSPIGNPHEARTSGSNRLLAPLFIEERAVLRVQGHVRLDEGDRPEPDLVLLRWRDDLYEHRSPGPADILLIIEVSDSTLSYDRGYKLARYAESAIPEVWIENIRARHIEAHRNPVNGEYAETRIYRPGETISPQAFPDLELPVSAIMGVPAETD